MPTIFFTDANDSYSVTATGSYNLAFLDGNDSLTVNGGTFTTALMGEGGDVITLKAGDALIYGDGGNDRFEIYASGFEARGGADNDLFNIRGGNNLILRGNGDDDRFIFAANSLNASMHGDDGDDVFNGNGRVVSGTIYGDAGNDTFIGFRNAGGTVPSLRGGMGSDTYRAHPTAPVNFIENAGEGYDLVEVSAGRNYVLPANIEELSVGNFAGSLTGHATLAGNTIANVIRGFDNAETISGLAGNDTLYGGGGDDAIDGGGGNDMLIGQDGNDQMAGGTGNDIYYVDQLGDSVKEAKGAGTDEAMVTVSGYTMAGNVENGTVNSATGVTLTGNGLANILTGNDGFDFLNGGEGADHVYGGANFDSLIGGGGNDVLDGQAGDDNMSGGAGNDTFYINSQSDNVFENPDEGTDTVYLNDPSGFALLSYTLPDNVENVVMLTGFSNHLSTVTGNALGNVMKGTMGEDDLWGMGGSDYLDGKGDGDILFGGDGADVIVGGNGDDFISGDGAQSTDFAGDTLTGGPGRDQFHYSMAGDSAPFIGRVDQITDFETGVDWLGIDIDANTNVDGQQQWVIVDSPSGAAGEMWLDSSNAASGDYVVYGENNGDGLVDFMVNIHAVTTFSTSDILL